MSLNKWRKELYIMNTKSITVGAIKFKSIKAAVLAAQKSMVKRGLEPIPYITAYQRIRNAEKTGLTISQIMNKPVRTYNKKEVLNEEELVENAS
jgi:hypothetical protein